jgi:nucleoside-diphosphate-sugar epimerase
METAFLFPWRSSVRYLILGCGNVGMELARRWTADGHVVTGTTTTPERVAQLREVCTDVAVLRGDDQAGVSRAAAHADAVVVTVSPRFTRAVNPAERADEYALALTATARAAAAAHHRVVFASSTSVYGRSHDVTAPLDETAPTTGSRDASPVNFLAAEHATLAAGQGAVVRLPDVYGHPRDIDYARRVELAHQLMGGRVPFCPDALLYRIDYRDAAQALRHVVERGLTGVFNAVPDGVPPPANAAVFGAITAANGWAELAYGCDIEAPVVAVSSARLRATGFAFDHSTVITPDPGAINPE